MNHLKGKKTDKINTWTATSQRRFAIHKYKRKNKSRSHPRTTFAYLSVELLGEHFLQNYLLPG